MTGTDSRDYVVVTHINLNKPSLANSDLALYISYLSKGFHLDQNDVVKGMEAFKTEFRYELSKETVSDDEEEDWDPGNHTNNMFRRRGDRSMCPIPPPWPLALQGPPVQHPLILLTVEGVTAP